MVLPNILVMSPRKLLAIVFGDGIEKRKAKVLDKKLLEKVWELSKKIILCAIVLFAAGVERLIGGSRSLIFPRVLSLFL